MKWVVVHVQSSIHSFQKNSSTEERMFGQDDFFFGLSRGQPFQTLESCDAVENRLVLNRPALFLSSDSGISEKKAAVLNTSF